MTTDPTGIRDAVLRIMAEHGHDGPVADDESLFHAGKLDSVAAMEVLLLLEGEYGVDLSDADFDITRLDTLRDIEALASRGRVASAT